MNLSRDFHGSKQLAGLKKAWRFDQNGWQSNSCTQQ